MRRLIASILLFHFIFYIGCASSMNSQFSNINEIEENPDRRNVFLLHKNGDIYEGEIYSLRHDSIMFFTKEVENPKSIAVPDGFLQSIRYNQIAGIKKDKLDKVLLTAASSALAVFSLLIISLSNDSDEGMPLFYIIPESAIEAVGVFLLTYFSGLMGSIAGLIFFGENVIQPDSKYNINKLRAFARYPNGEPVWMSDI